MRYDNHTFSMRMCTWDTWKEYPAKPKYYMISSVVLTDIELDQCPKWKEKVSEITREYYEKIRIHQSV